MAQDTVRVKNNDRINFMKPVIPDFLQEQPLQFSSFALGISIPQQKSMFNRWGMYSPEFTEEMSSPKIDLTAPWKLQLQRKEENKTLYSILGSVQLGGTAYLLYRHIKKNKGIQ